MKVDRNYRIQIKVKLDQEIRQCRRCRLHKTRNSAVPGEGPIDTEIMICGQAPGRTEDRSGRPFIGMAGKFLDQFLRLLELARETVFITSSVKCFPPNNRPPRSDELRACRPYLEEQIKIIKPKLIIALGNCALRSLLGGKLSISKNHGKPQQRNGIMIFPTFHPAAAMRFPKIRILMEEDFRRLQQWFIDEETIENKKLD